MHGHLAQILGPPPGARIRAGPRPPPLAVRAAEARSGDVGDAGGSAVHGPGVLGRVSPRPGRARRAWVGGSGQRASQAAWYSSAVIWPSRYLAPSESIVSGV